MDKFSIVNDKKLHLTFSSVQRGFCEVVPVDCSLCDVNVSKMQRSATNPEPWNGL
jgi:hypothetical protein